MFRRRSCLISEFTFAFFCIVTIVISVEEDFIQDGICSEEFRRAEEGS